MKKNEFQPFSGVLYDQNNELRNEADEVMSPDELMKMNWLLNNVVGEIPEIGALRDEAKSIVELKGVTDSE